MMTIGQLARKVGLSRTALLYYDRIGILQPTTRSPAGYRLYDRDSLNRLRRIRVYRQAGLGVKNIKRLLDVPDNPSSDSFKKRIYEIDLEIAGLRTKQRLLIRLLKQAGEKDMLPELTRDSWAEMLRRSGMRSDQLGKWHVEFEKRLPLAHRSFLLWLGIPEQEVERIRTRALSEGTGEGNDSAE